ncbi:uncharacterized protein LOC144516894 isoform X2 [Sander vitreus]
MAGRLLFVFLMYSFHEVQAQALLPPKLTVNPAVITVTETVTLNCQTPSSVSVSQCYFYTLSGGTVRVLSCLQTLTGTELLKMSHQSLPTEVQVRCFYTVKVGEGNSQSPYSDTSSITIQALLPPKLTVNPPVITETDSVTLNCQTPSSVSVSQCYFYTLSRRTVNLFSCLQTLTGTELLKMANKNSSVEVEVKCYYTVKVGEGNSQSPYSDTSSITIHTLLPPKLTVNPPVITETDSVTLNCQTPSSVSVSQCYFHKGGTVDVFSCLQTLTGTELLKMANKNSSVEVEVKCYYTVKVGERNSQSPYSDTSSITIHSQTPRMAVHHSYGDDVLFTCSLPGSANPDTRCNLYFGEASRPVLTTNISGKKTSKKESFCQFTVTIDDLLSRLRLVQQRDASCDYSLGSEPNSLSPRSDGYSLTDIVERESSMTPTMPTFSMTKGQTVDMPSSTGSSTSTYLTPVKQAPDIVERESSMTPTMPTFSMTKGQTVDMPSSTGSSTSTYLTPVKQAPGQTVDMPSSTGSSTSTYLTPVKQAPETWILKFVAVVTGCGVIVGVILLVSAILYNKKTGSEEVKRQDPQNKNFDTYHTYYTIAEESAASALKDMVYSTVQTH